MLKENEMYVYTPPEVAKILRIRKEKVYKLIESGMLPALKLGGYKITKQSLEKFLSDGQGIDYDAILESDNGPQEVNHPPARKEE